MVHADYRVTKSGFLNPTVSHLSTVQAYSYHWSVLFGLQSNFVHLAEPPHFQV